MLRGLLIIGLSFILLVVGGCGRKVVPSISSEVRDSINIKIVPRIVEVKVPGETVTVKEYIKCDSVTNKPIPVKFSAKGKKAKVNVEVDADGAATATGGCEDLEAQVIAMDKEIFRLRTESKKEVKTVTVYETRKIDKFCRGFTATMILALIALIFVKLKKFIP